MYTIKTLGTDKVNKELLDIEKSVQLKTKQTGFNLVQRAAGVGRRLIRAKTSGKGTLAQSIKTRKSKGTTTNQWSVFQDDRMTRREHMRGENYAEYADRGFNPHYAPVRGNTNLQYWIKKNLGESALKNAMRKGYIFVGQNTPWSSSGLRFSDKMYDAIIRNAQQFDNDVDEALRKS